MVKITSFFWYCSGADVSLLKRTPSEGSKYVGIGAAIFFTGLFAALSGGYAIYTVFDSVAAASLFGSLWGLMIFNLDRYIVSSMRKEERASRELLMASPRLVLAILFSIVIAKPLELKIFEKEIQPELILMEQQKYGEQESQLRSRYQPAIDSLKFAVGRLKNEISIQEQKRDALSKAAQEEADGTGGSRRKNLGPIYKAKKADADRASGELDQLRIQHEIRISSLEKHLSTQDSLMRSGISSLERKKRDGLAARMEALDRLTKQSSAIFWAHWFILLLFIAIETSPVFVKLISNKGPYDNLLRIEEHSFTTLEREALIKNEGDAKDRAATYILRDLS